MISDSGQSSATSSKGDRLSAKLKSLPGANDPYEASSNKDIGNITGYLYIIHLNKRMPISSFYIHFKGW